MRITSLFRRAKMAHVSAGQSFGNRRPRYARRRRQFESLEPRRLLATDVYVDNDWEEVTNGGGLPNQVDTGDIVSSDADGGDDTGPAFTNRTFGTDAFATIQDAINAVDVGGTVHVNAGTYLENVVLAKQVTLLGRQAGVDARGRAASESTVTAAGTIFTLQTGAASSVIDGFAISGGARGIESTSGPLNNLQVLNNRVLGFTNAGIFLNDSGTDITVNQNVVDGSGKVGGGGLVHLDTDSFAGFHLTNNAIINGATATGFFVDGNHNVGPSATRAPLISGNLISDNNTGMNLGTRAFGSLLPPALPALFAGFITNNTFHSNNFDGLQGGIQHALISGNTFSDNGRSGLALTSFGNTAADRGAQNSQITQNFFLGNVAEDLFLSSAQAAGTISTNNVFENSFGSARAVTYNGTETINASGNWWGTAANPESANRIGGAGAANVDYTPWLNSGVDVGGNPANGFQGDFSVLNVDDDSPQSSLSVAPGRIAEGIALVTTGGVINAAAGTYAESVEVNKSVSLRGSQFGVDARGRVASESVIIPAVADESVAVVYVSADDVTIDGFTVNGDGPVAGGVLLLDGTTFSNAARGIAVDGDDGRVLNNIVTNTYRRGVQYGAVVNGIGGLVHQNDFRVIGADVLSSVNSGDAILSFSDPSVTDNDVTTARTGITFIQVYSPSITPITISGNNINATNGIALNETSSGIPAITVTNNTVTTDDNGIGLLLWSNDGVVNVTGNDFAGTGVGDIGVYAWDGTANDAMNVAVSGGSINAYETGALLTNEETFGPFGPALNNATLTLNNVTITGGAAGTTGAVVQDTVLGTTAVSLGLSGGTDITNTTTGLRVDGPLAKVAGDTLNDTAFSGQTGDYITLANAAYGDGDPDNQQLQIDASAVRFDGEFAANMTAAERTALEGKLFHEPDDGTLGFIQLIPQGPTVDVDANGNLVIEGTSDNDTVTITGVGIGTGEYVVTTQRGNGPVVTTNVVGVTGGFDINLLAGNDHLTMNRVYVAGAILVEMESGSDTVILGNVDVVSSGQRLQIALGDGDDTIDGKRLFIGGDQLIYGGGGDDQLLFNGFASPQFTLGTSARGLAFWSGDAGNDTVSITYGFIVQSWGIFLGDGDDTLDVFGSAASGDVIFSGDADDDTLTVDTNFFDATHVIFGLAGNDTLLLRAGLGTEFTAISTGDGNDRVTVDNQTTNRLDVVTEAGDDEVDVQASAFDQFFVQLGEDNDQLTVRGNLVQLDTGLNGGPGSADRLLDQGNDFRGRFLTGEFEL